MSGTVMVRKRYGTVHTASSVRAMSTLARLSLMINQVHNNPSEEAASPLASHTLSNHLSHHHVLPTLWLVVLGN